MRQVKNLLVGLVLATLSALAFAGECTKGNQEGCYDLVVGNFKVGPKTQGIDKTYADEKEHGYRVLKLGSELMAEAKAGNVETAKSRSFLVYVYGNSAVPTAYKIRVHEGRTQSAPSSIEDVTGKVKHPSFADGKKDLGAPTKVYRIQSPFVGASLQWPWDKLTGVTFLICAEDHLTVYPPDGEGMKKQGLWVMPEQLAALQSQGVRGSIAPFVSKE